MKMSELVMTILITLLAIFPFMWFTYLGKKTFRNSHKIIKDLLKEEGLSFNQKEFWNHNFIGIDETKNRLLFIKVKSPENTIFKIDLNDVKSCQIHKNTNDYKRDKKIESELQTLDLELGFYSKKANIKLNFYDIEDRLSENFEMKRAEKWQQSIFANIPKNSVKSTAA